jgi:hypothetical protein
MAAGAKRTKPTRSSLWMKVSNVDLIEGLVVCSGISIKMRRIATKALIGRLI